MSMAELRAANVARDREWNTGSERVSMTFRATELAGEVGEACNVIKKLERERIGLVGSRDTKEHLAEELADIVICTDLVAMDADIDLDAAIAAKFNATSEKNGLTTRLSISKPAMTLPFEATPEMVKAALDLVWEESGTYNDLVCRLWRAMAAVAPDQSAAVRDVQAERRRQIDEENFRAADDDNYVNGSLAAAASCYAMAAARKNCLGWEPVGWPWHYSWWKPTAARRDLVKAGALIIAEIERLDRLSAPASEGAV
ncbi:MazG-like family protein [Brucella intermedia]|uniref:MazG-like family protein n=1 Tax=Brucella intermedia TaxID=94625 RepID=UPI0034CF8925